MNCQFTLICFERVHGIKFLSFYLEFYPFPFQNTFWWKLGRIFSLSNTRTTITRHLAGVAPSLLHLITYFPLSLILSSIRCFEAIAKEILPKYRAFFLRRARFWSNKIIMKATMWRRNWWWTYLLQFIVSYTLDICQEYPAQGKSYANFMQCTSISLKTSNFYESTTK